jgi:hypothetical protein
MQDFQGAANTQPKRTDAHLVRCKRGLGEPTPDGPFSLMLSPC